MSQFGLRTPKEIFHERPSGFTIDHFNPLARGLVFAGLGDVPGGLRYQDSSLYGNHGTLTNMAVPATATSGWAWDNTLRRWALSFDGSNDYVSFSSINLGTVHSVCSWINFSVAGIAIGGAVIYYAPYIDATTIRYRNGSSTAANVAHGKSAGVTWHFAIVRNNSTTINFYVNGVRITDGTSDGANAMALSGIGAYGYGAGQIAAKMADSLMFNRILSPSEIRQLADPSNVMLSGLILPPRRRLWAVPSGAATTIRWPWQQRRHRRMAGVS